MWGNAFAAVRQIGWQPDHVAWPDRIECIALDADVDFEAFSLVASDQGPRRLEPHAPVGGGVLSNLVSNIYDGPQ
jgi:hypothetical protein